MKPCWIIPIVLGCFGFLGVHPANAADVNNITREKSTETGPLTYKALQDELNRMNDEERQVALHFLNNLDISRKSPGERLLAGIAINDPVSIPANPDFGESKYDPAFPSLEQYYNPKRPKELSDEWSEIMAVSGIFTILGFVVLIAYFVNNAIRENKEKAGEDNWSNI